MRTVLVVMDSQALAGISSEFSESLSGCGAPSWLRASGGSSGWARGRVGLYLVDLPDQSPRGLLHRSFRSSDSMSTKESNSIPVLGAVDQDLRGFNPKVYEERTLLLTSRPSGRS